MGSPAIDVGFGQTVSGLVGPLDYTFRTYSISPDTTSVPVVAGSPATVAATPAVTGEFTVG